jgi:predicted nucleic acid-binding protein
MAQQLNDSCAFCRVTQMALLRHLTNGKIMGTSVQSQFSAWQTYDICVRDVRCTFLEEPAAVAQVFRQLTSSNSPAHGEWTDGYLAAFAIASGSKFVSFDHGISRFQQLQFELLL